MGQKLYIKSESGIRFKSSRKPGEVRIPNYVYDLWVPLLGVETLGVYAVYCRLEREGMVKGMSMSDLAKACRIGKSKLEQINKDLERCGFVKVRAPTGKARLMHWTNEIEILDPPKEITQALISEYMPTGREHEILAPWLVDDEETGPPEVPNGTAGGVEGDYDAVPNGTPMIESPDLQPSFIEGGIAEKNPPSPSSDLLPASDAHQHHVDAANGSTAPDPAQVVAEHLHSGYMGAPVPLPSGKQERKKWIEAGRRLLRRFENYDLRQLCYSVDCYWQNPDDFWRDKPCHDETLDLIARAYLQRQAAAPAPPPPPLPRPAPDPLAVAWGRVLDDLSTQTAAPTFKAHFAGSQLVDRQNGDIMVYLPNPDTLAWFKVKPSMETLLKRAVAAQMGDVRIAYTGVKP